MITDPDSPSIIALRVLKTDDGGFETQLFSSEAAPDHLISKGAIDAINRLTLLISRTSGVSPFGVIRSIYCAHGARKRIAQENKGQKS